MPNIEEHVRDFREAVLSGVDRAFVEIEAPAPEEELVLLEESLGQPLPADLRELWGVSGSGYWSFSQPLFSPVESIEMSGLWEEILSEWSPAPESELQFGTKFVAFGAPPGEDILYLLDGPDAGAIGLFDSQDAMFPTKLANTLDHYLAVVATLAQAGQLTVRTHTFPDGTRRTEPAWIGSRSGVRYSVPLEMQRTLGVGPRFL